MSTKGVKFVFRDFGNYAGNGQPVWIPGKQTYAKILRVNTNDDRKILIQVYNTATNAWETFDTFSQKQGDWDYNVGDVGIAIGDDGSMMVSTNAGDGSGKSEIKDATAYYSPQLTGFGAAPGSSTQYHEGVDTFARQQIQAFQQAITAATIKAQGAQDTANGVVKTIKTEIEKQLGKVSAGLSAQSVKDILFSKAFDEKLYTIITDKTSALATNIVGAAQYWGFVKGKDAAYALLKERGIIKD